MLDIQKFDWGWMDEPVKIELGITKIVLLNNKIRNTFDFNQYREEFKKFSYRKNRN